MSALACVILSLAFAWGDGGSGQEPGSGGTVELKFHRVHLKNGNFVDGNLIRQNPREVLIDVKSAGQMTINRDLIDRVEFIRMRTLNEKAEEVKAPTTETVRQVPVPSLPEVVKPPEAPAANGRAPQIPPEIQKKLEAILAQAAKADANRKWEILFQIRALGESAIVWLAAHLESYEGRALEDAAGTIGFLKAPASLPVLLHQFSSSKPAVRAHSVQAAGAFGDPSAVKPIEVMLRDPADAVRVAAVTSLEWLAPVTSIPLIAAHCVDPSPEVRVRAFSALAKIAEANKQADAVMGAIESVVQRAPPELKVTAASNLGLARRKEACGLLCRLLDDFEPSVRTAAASALVSIASPDSGPAILQRLRAETDKWTRLHLLSAAQVINLVDAVEPLIPWLEDPDNDMRNAAHSGLKKLTGVTIGQDPKAWAQWWAAKQKSRR
jgi:HEAT repeat protein